MRSIEIPVKKIFNSIFVILVLICFSFTTKAQVMDSTYHEPDSVFNLEITPSNEIVKLWDTSRLGIIALKNTDRQTLCIELTDDEHCCFNAPCRGIVTSNFGWRGGRLHAGVDIDLETGDPVYAAFDGMVRQAGWHKGYGNFVIVSHFNGLETLYGHLSVLKIGMMQPVKSGQLIGLGGNTGKSYGSHLHLEIRYFGKPINPKLMIDFQDYSLHTDTLQVGNSSTFSKSNSQISEAKGVSSIVEVTTDSAKLVKDEKYDKNRMKDLKEKEKKKTTEKKLKEEKVKKEKEKIKKAKVVYHTVKKGDTLYGISKKYGTTVAIICKLNKIKPTDILDLGQKLKVK